jgi:subtilase family serine protease
MIFTICIGAAGCYLGLSISMQRKTRAMSFELARLTKALALASLILFFAAAPSRAETTAALAGNHLEAAADLAAQSAAASHRSLQMEIYLAPRNQPQLDRLLQDQQDPGSLQYHHWLTPTEYDQQFGPTDADVADVTRWLTNAGFTVTHASAHERRIAFSGDVETAQAAFQVHIVGSGDGSKFANLEDPRVPESLAPKISHLAGLDNLHGTIWNTLIPEPPFNNNGFTEPFFGPTDIRTFSDEISLLTAMPAADGTSQCVAVSEGSDVDQPSLAQFNQVFGLPAFVMGSNYDEVFPDGSPGAPGSQGGAQPYGEAMLDVEYAHGIAPGAEIVLYAANAGTSVADPVQALVDSAIAAVSDTTHHCFSVAISWAQCGEPTSFYTNLETNVFKPGAVEGQSIFVATGDVGTAAPPLGSCVVPSKAAKPNIEENAGSNFVTAVGASMFQATYDGSGNDNATAASVTQNPWSFIRKSPKIPFLQGSGASTGGYSKIFPRPTWQNGVKGIAGKFRAVPDLVLGGGNLGGSETIGEKKGILTFKGNNFPAPNFWECFDAGLANGSTANGPQWTVTGGTSIVPPQYAAILAIINQKAGAPSGQGLINPKLYGMAQANVKNLSAVGIHDIVSGKNGTISAPGFPAKKGFDLASGWGAIDMSQFVDAFIAFVPAASQEQK